MARHPRSRGVAEVGSKVSEPGSTCAPSSETILGVAIVVGYARVSTDHQQLLAQTDALTAAGCERVFTDRLSGVREDRPGLLALLGQVRAGDTVVVVALDRLGRSLSGVIRTIETLTERGVLLRSLREGIDYSTATGRMLAGIFAALAGYERELMHERAAAAREAARLRGRHTGRPPKLTAGQVRQLQALRAGGESINDLARTFGVSRATVYRFLTDPEAAPAATEAPMELTDASCSPVPSAPRTGPVEETKAAAARRPTRPPDPHPPGRRTAGAAVKGDRPARPGRPVAAAANGKAEQAAPGLGRWRRHKSINVGAGVLESTPVFRGGMNSSKWQVETGKDPDLPGVLRVAVDGFVIGSVERLAAGRYAARWEGHRVPDRPCTRRQDAVLQVLASELAARRRYYAARSQARAKTR